MPGARCCQGREVARRERQQHEEHKADSADLRQHHWRLEGSVSKRDATSPRFRVSEQSLVGDAIRGFLSDRETRRPTLVCQVNLLKTFLSPSLSPGPLGHSPFRPIRNHSHLRNAASAMPVATGLGGACGSNIAPVRKHAPRRNSHFIGPLCDIVSAHVMSERTTWVGTRRPSAPDRLEHAGIANRGTARHSGVWITPVEWSTRPSFKKPATPARWRGQSPVVSDSRMQPFRGRSRMTMRLRDASASTTPTRVSELWS